MNPVASVSPVVKGPMLELLNRIVTGSGTEEDLSLLEELALIVRMDPCADWARLPQPCANHTKIF